MGRIGWIRLYCVKSIMHKRYVLVLLLSSFLYHHANTTNLHFTLRSQRNHTIHSQAFEDKINEEIETAMLGGKGKEGREMMVFGSKRKGGL